MTILPAGATLAITVSAAPLPIGQMGTAYSQTLTASGGTPVPLVTGSAADVEPAWAPNGNDVAFVSDRDGDVGLYLVNVETGNIRRLSARPGNDTDPAWLADGRLVFTTWVAGVPRLRTMNPASPSQIIDVGLNSGEPQHAAGLF